MNGAVKWLTWIGVAGVLAAVVLSTVTFWDVATIWVTNATTGKLDHPPAYQQLEASTIVFGMIATPSLVLVAIAISLRRSQGAAMANDLL
jgi:hypothetical protein